MASRCVRLKFQILFAALALMEVPVLAIALQGDHLVGSAAAAAAVAGRIPRTTHCNKKFLEQDYFSDDWRNHHRAGCMVAGVSSKISAQRSGSRHDQTATRRRQLQQSDQTTTLAEVEVLVGFKEGVTNDSLGALNSWNANDTDACQWKGVTCAQQSKSIVALELGSFQLTGTISPLLGGLTNLQTLDLSDNSFNGEIPTSLLNCSHLSYLALRNNNLTGQIPSQVGDLLHLQYLDLGENLLLAGLIPASLSNCSFLRLIRLDYTRLSGEIPPTLGQLSRLEILNLTNTFNSGTIPKSLGNCSSLLVLQMGNIYNDGEESNPNNPVDELSGELPSELGNLKQLKGLGIGGTSIRGTGIPTWIANLTELISLALPYNAFSGDISGFLGNLPLEFLNLEGNSFSGAIPAAISNCSNLFLLGLGFNPNVTGAVPPELGMLSKLGTLLLQGNSLTGTIPSSLSNCSALRVLYLGLNPLLDPQPVPSWVASLVNLTDLFLTDMNLHGEIPTTLGEASKLQYIYIALNQLSGAVPVSLGNSTSLVHLELEMNQLSGELPPEIWTLSLLQHLDISLNLLIGTLPASIGNLSLLQVFDCSRNFLSGGIPSELGSLQSLELANFNSNNFDGFIPHSLGNCSALSTGLGMSNNQLSGSIPGSLGTLTGMEQLYLSGNRLEGEIPVDLMRCTALGILDLSHNLLVGSIPQEMGQLLFLQGLDLNHNKLFGSLPDSLGLLTGLQYLDISYNKFYGAVPGEAIASMSGVLQTLNMSHNLLSGPLPVEIGQLALVYNLDFSENNFSGSIPSSLGDCKSLQRLDLSINNLSGGIPAALAQLPYLAFVNVSYNHLQGPLPGGGVFNSSNLTAASFLGNPGLCGSMLKGCRTVAMGPSPASPTSCTAFRCGSVKTAIIVACTGAGVCLISIALLICSLLYRHGKNDDPQSDVALTFATGHELKVSKQELLSMILERSESMIGSGGTSTVYKGVLKGGTIVAVKVMNLLSDPDDHERNQQVAAQFYKEVRTLSQLRHRNILKVLGLFSTLDIKALILEFMPKASLHQQLYRVEECELTWDARLNIALGVAQGLVYLHSQAHVPVIHRDLKPSNVLLDANLQPKLGDFGISQVVNHDKLGDHVDVTATNFCGTIGYIPPEYGATTRVSTKGDVYSYGVILLELLTRRHPIVTVEDSESHLGLRGHQSRHLVDWVLDTFDETPLAVLDPMLLISERISTSNGTENNSGEQMKLLMRVGLLCTQNDPQSRPHMNDVLAMLLEIKERGSDPAHVLPWQKLQKISQIGHTRLISKSSSCSR